MQRPCRGARAFGLDQLLHTSPCQVYGDCQGTGQPPHGEQPCGVCNCQSRPKGSESDLAHRPTPVWFTAGPPGPNSEFQQRDLKRSWFNQNKFPPVLCSSTRIPISLGARLPTLRPDLQPFILFLTSQSIIPLLPSKGRRADLVSTSVGLILSRISAARSKDT